jgi:ornithine carbamoyltransferase
MRGVEYAAPEEMRAKRPIIEFAANLQLFNHGTHAKQAVDAVDTVTTDVFSTIEGARSYNIDGFQLSAGARILVTADKDGFPVPQKFIW